jgi:hypothetical protein
VSNFQELSEFFWYIEEKYHLLELKINGVYIWEYIRTDLYIIVGEKSGVFDKPHTKLNLQNKVFSFFKYLYNTIRFNYFTLSSKDVVVFSHPRVVKVKNKFIDIYTKYFIDELVEKGVDVLEFETAYLSIHYKEKENFTHYTDWIALTQRVLQRFIQIDIDNSTKTLITQVEQEFVSQFNIQLDLLSYVSEKAKKFKSIFIIYDKIFKKVKPKTFYIVVPYVNAAQVSAAKKNNIEVVELQHGALSKYHLGYVYPREAKLAYYPDKIFVWNSFWKNMDIFSLPASSIIVDKFRYLEKCKKELALKEKKQNQLLVLSQGTIGEDIAKKVLVLKEQFKKYHIMYKLHPGEYERWKFYPSLVKLSKFANVTIIQNEIPLYELFASSALQIGVYSSAIYEGNEFGCKTILLNINGIENMQEFIVQNKIEVL